MKQVCGYVNWLCNSSFSYRLVRENESAPERITEIIDALVQDFVYSNNSNARYGGLIGLAATAIALGPVNDHTT